MIRLLYYLPIERMKDFKAEVDRLVGEYIVELEEENKELKEENIDLKIQVENLEPNYENWYNLINWERKDREELTKRLTIDVLILIIALVIQSLSILLK